MTRHVLIEIAGGVATHVKVYAEDGGEVVVWLRDYDDLTAQGYTYQESIKCPPIAINACRVVEPPKHFTKH